MFISSCTEDEDSVAVRAIDREMADGCTSRIVWFSKLGKDIGALDGLVRMLREDVASLSIEIKKVEELHIKSREWILDYESRLFTLEERFAKLQKLLKEESLFGKRTDGQTNPFYRKESAISPEGPQESRSS